MAIYAAFWALFGAGEILAGDWSGIIHFGPVVLILGLMFLCWKRPMSGGIVTLLAGVALTLRFFSSMMRPEDRTSAALIIGGPFILAGIIFIIFALLSRPKGSEDSTDL
jgi:hypothetical protein